LKYHKVPWLAQRRGGAELIRVAGIEADDAEVVPPAVLNADIETMSL
jgi:hypothetical protein